MPEVSIAEWEEFINRRQQVHLLQTSGWGKFKAGFGWKPKYIISGLIPEKQLGAQVLFRNLLPNLTVAYIPKGPVGWLGESNEKGLEWSSFLTDLDDLCHQHKAIFVIMEPDLWQMVGLNCPPGFSVGNQTIQPPRTILVDLSKGEDAVLSSMKQKTRYNIRLAQKKGVIVHSSNDIDGFYKLMMITGQRDAFGVHSLDYYRKVYGIFHQRNECELLIAEREGDILAGLLVFCSGTRAWYFYGASSDASRELMPTYLVQWEAIKWAIHQGCTVYDLWGIPDEDEEKLEAEFLNRSDGLWGVYRFKRGFGGRVVRAAGPFERVYMPLMYQIYRWSIRMRGHRAE